MFIVVIYGFGIQGLGYQVRFVGIKRLACARIPWFTNIKHPLAQNSRAIPSAWSRGSDMVLSTTLFISLMRTWTVSKGR